VVLWCSWRALVGLTVTVDGVAVSMAQPTPVVGALDSVGTDVSVGGVTTLDPTQSFRGDVSQVCVARAHTGRCHLHAAALHTCGCVISVPTCL
jgi:hypothetical protein